MKQSHCDGSKALWDLFSIDLKKLNEVSKFDSYPMARMDKLIEKLGKARYLTTLDLTKQIHLIPKTKC